MFAFRRQTSLLVALLLVVGTTVLLLRRELTDYYDVARAHISSATSSKPNTNHGTPPLAFEEAPVLTTPLPVAPPPITPTPETLSHDSSVGELPDDYLAAEDDLEWCRANYGRGYLDYIATHHLPYCEKDSASKIECFRTHNKDEFCVVQGLQFDDTDREHPSVDCQLRNFTLEKNSDTAKAKEYEDIKDVRDFNSYFFDTGAGPQLRAFKIKPDSTGDSDCSAMRNDGKYYLYVKREGNKNLWHKLTELWQSMVTIDALQMSINPVTGKPYLSAEQRADLQLVFHDTDVSPVHDIWGLITGSDKPPIRRSDLPSGCLGNVILPLAGSSSPFWHSHWENRDCSDQFMIRAFLKRVYSHLDIVPVKRLTEETVVTIIDRKSTRRIMHLEAYVERLRVRHPSITVQVLDFATLSLKEQILTVRSTDVLIGVLGAGMTHLMFLPEESSVAEIMPSGTSYAGFRNLAKMRQLGYFHLHSQSPGEWNATVAEAQEGKLKDLAFGNEDGSAANLTGHLDGGKMGVWQQGDIFLTNDEFQALADAAINGQADRGLRNVDVYTSRVRTKLPES